MTNWKPFPEIDLQDGNVEGLYRIKTMTGRVIVAGHFAEASEAERFVVCWNACRKIAFPDAHITAQDEYCKRLEQLRKDAVAMAGTGEGVWNFDLSTAPKDSKLWLASECGKVIPTYWDKKREQWAGFATNGKPPVAWQPYAIPVHPSASMPDEVAA